MADFSDYSIAEPCLCRLEGKVAEFHDDTGHHPDDQYERIVSPPIDRGSLGPYYNAVLAAWEIYGEMHQYDWVLYQTGWSYYPWICPYTGTAQWSPPVFSGRWYWNDSGCVSMTAPSWGLVPQDAQYYKFVIDLYHECPTDVPCTGVTNFSPLFDNIRIYATHRSNAPEIAFDSGGAFQDGFSATPSLGPGYPGNADSGYEVHHIVGAPAQLGDSLVVERSDRQSQHPMGGAPLVAHPPRGSGPDHDPRIRRLEDRRRRRAQHRRRPRGVHLWPDGFGRVPDRYIQEQVL